MLLGPAQRPGSLAALKIALADRSGELAERIRNGEADDGEWRKLVFAHVRDTVHAKLEAANPKWLEADA